MSNPQVIVLARIQNTGLRKTGRWIRPDGVNYVEDTESCSVAVALVWSRDLDDRVKAEDFAQREGYEVMVLDDTEDVLERAKANLLDSASTA